MPLSQKSRNLLERWSSIRPAKSLEIQNFKAFGAEGSGKFPIKPITLIFGANSAGKSSLLHSLLWLDHGISTDEWDVYHPRLAGDLVDLGGFTRYAHKHENDRVISITQELESDLGELRVTVGFGKIKVTEHAEGLDEDENEVQNPITNRADRYSLELPEDSIGLRSYEIARGEHTIMRFSRRGGLMRLEVLEIPLDIIHNAAQREVRNRSSFQKLTKESVSNAISQMMEGEPMAIKGQYLLSQGFSPGMSRMIRDARVHGASVDSALTAVTRAMALLTRHVSRSFSGFGRPESMGTIYIGPLRVYPDRDLTMLTETDRSDWMGSGLFAWELLRELPEVRERLNRIIKDVLNLGYEFRMTNRSLTPEEALDVVDRELVAYFQNRGNEEAEMLDDPADVLSEKFAAILQKAASNNDSGHLRLVDARTGTALAAKDVGMGISQVIPILVAASALERKIICMEQPELHLHPGLQTKLADALIASAMGQRNTLLIETHSEHLILRILRRIRETTEGDMQDWPDDLRRACPNGIRPEDVAVLYVEPGTEGAKVQCLRINELGEFIDEWPKGFFEERIREVL
jgi:hypothetical protein